MKTINSFKYRHAGEGLELIRHHDQIRTGIETAIWHGTDGDHSHELDQEIQPFRGPNQSPISRTRVFIQKKILRLPRSAAVLLQENTVKVNLQVLQIWGNTMHIITEELA